MPGGRAGELAGVPPAGDATSEGVLTTTTSMSAPRAPHTATALPDGRILVAGGFSDEEGAARGAEIYEPGTERFSPLPPMKTLRHSHTATLPPGGKVLIAGGYGQGRGPRATAWLYRP